MPKSTFQTDKISGKQTVILKECLLCSIVNDGATDMYVTFNDQRRLLPPANPSTRLPVVQFTLDGKGYTFDATIKIDFTGGTGAAYVDYCVLLPEPKC